MHAHARVCVSMAVYALDVLGQECDWTRGECWTQLLFTVNEPAARCHLGACQKCEASASTTDLRARICMLTRSPGDLQAHTSLRNTSLDNY